MSAEQAAGQGTGVLPLIDHDDAIDDHHVDAFGVLVRIVKAGAVGNRLGVEQDEIGSVADGDRTAVCRPSAAAAPPVILWMACGRPRRPRSRA